MNPFTDKSLHQLRDMVQNGDLSDPDLDALCAKHCEGYIQSWDNNRPSWLPPGKSGIGGACPKYTTDGREAMRLLVKYQLELGPNGHCGGPDIFWECAPCLEDVRGPDDEPTPLTQNPCRAIAEAAVTAELTRMIEGDGE